MREESAALLLAALFVAGVAWAEGFDPNAPAATDKKSERAVELMTLQLSLTDDQQEVVRTALDTKMEKLNQLDQEIVARDKEIQEESDKAILSALTPSQRKKYPAVKEQLDNESPPRPSHRMSLSNAGRKRKPAGY